MPYIVPDPDKQIYLDLAEQTHDTIYAAYTTAVHHAQQIREDGGPDMEALSAGVESYAHSLALDIASRPAREAKELVRKSRILQYYRNQPQSSLNKNLTDMLSVAFTNDMARLEARRKTPNV